VQRRAARPVSSTTAPWPTIHARLSTALIPWWQARNSATPFDADRGALGVHAGLDLIVKNGTPVHAPLDLTNLRIGYYSDEMRKGYYVLGIDQYGREWYFGHMTAVWVKQGGSIAKGGTIGTVGKGHVHVQLKQEPGGAPIDPSAALDSAAAAGAGPGAGAPDPYTAQTAGSAYQPSRYSIGGPRYGIPIATGLNGVDAAIAGLLPDLANLTQAVAGVDDATAAASDNIVVATDAILDHIGYKNKDGAGQLGYINQNGGLDAGAAGNWTKTGGDGMSVGGPHFGDPITAGAKVGADFGDGWQQGIEDITPQIEDTTSTTLQQLQDDVFIPWQDATRQFFMDAGFGYAGACGRWDPLSGRRPRSIGRTSRRRGRGFPLQWPPGQYRRRTGSHWQRQGRTRRTHR
jgi:hypothetical protein